MTIRTIFVHVSFFFLIVRYDQDYSTTTAAPSVEWPDDVMNVNLDVSFSQKIPVGPIKHPRLFVSVFIHPTR